MSEQLKPESSFRFRAGDVVWSPSFGRGVIQKMDDDSNCDGRPVMVCFIDCTINFTLDGRRSLDETFPTLSLADLHNKCS